MSDKLDTDSDGPIIDDNIIRIQLRKSCQKKWELRTRNLSPGVRFPTIQLFDCEGNLLVETNDENISIKSSDYDESNLRTSQSLREKDYRHFIDKKPLRKHNTISGGKIYTRIYRTPLKISNNVENVQKGYVIRDNNGVTNIPNKLTVNNIQNFQPNSLDTTPFQSDGLSEGSSYKSSDNETCEDDKQVLHKQILEPPFTNGITKSNDNETDSTSLLSEPEHVNESLSNKINEVDLGLHKSRSLTDAALGITKGLKSDTLTRSRSGACVYNPPHNKVPFLSTYLKSLPKRTSSNPDWLGLRRKKIENSQNSRLAAKRQELPKLSPEKASRCRKGDNASDTEFINIATDVAADCEMKKRLKMYRRGLSEIEHRERKMSVSKRRHSVSDVTYVGSTSSSESVDEADLVLSRLKRRILKNKFREKRQKIGAQYLFNKCPCPKRSSDQSPSDGGRNEGGGAPLRSRHAMGSNISQHSAKGLKGRRARSSGDLCNGDSKSNTESSVCGSVVGDVMGWNRSLPNHLDGNRHLADYSRVNNNYAEFSTYRHPKGGRGLRYRVSKSGELC
ncbi:hypothetical protein NE865_07615 [Phthorimaea operculella]|nr:hypothetical protein NE865_07615 [Phthorimaea operculella]